LLKETMVAFDGVRTHVCINQLEVRCANQCAMPSQRRLTARFQWDPVYRNLFQVHVINEF